MSDSDLSIDGGLVRQLAALLDETGLSEIEYAVGDRRIRVAKSAGTQVAYVPQAAAAGFRAPTAAEPTPAARVAAAGAVKSPMVGTAYLAPQPGAAPFVKVGDRVGEGDVLLIIEAMKVMNEIRSPRAGRVAEILVEDGVPVEFGQVLLVVD
jgi:acetyl-CoA carboxylase biotin carboxyl carrier protein